MIRLLLVEDDRGLGYILKEYLELHGYQVALARDGEEGWKCYRQQHFDLCILDVMMPKKDGFQLAQEIRGIDKQIPLIFLTSKSLKVDKLKGFRIGADDYIVKPIDEEELIARIEAIIKRSRLGVTSQPEAETYQIGRYCFDYSNQTLILGKEKQIITNKESEILRMLCRSEGHILDRKTALKQIWGEADYFKRRSMDVFVSRLRKYLSGDDRVRITNVHGRGYILTAE